MVNFIDLKNAAYILWVNYGAEGWQPIPCPNLKSALLVEKHSQEFLLSKEVDFEVVEKE